MNRRVLLALGAVVALGACGEAAASKPTTTEQTEITAEAEAPEITEAPTRQGSAGTMPDVVGMDLQAAQDRIQAETDVFWSDSRDATGQDRMQIIDSNWVVVAQSPAAGTPLDDDDTPMLDVVKEGER